MAVYVDELRDWGWKHGPSCHLLADTVGELHEFAGLLGLKRAWFQRDPRPHYDLVESNRKKAVRLGAKEISLRQLAEFLKRTKTQ